MKIAAASREDDDDSACCALAVDQGFMCAKWTTCP